LLVRTFCGLRLDSSLALTVDELTGSFDKVACTAACFKTVLLARLPHRNCDFKRDRALRVADITCASMATFKRSFERFQLFSSAEAHATNKQPTDKWFVFRFSTPLRSMSWPYTPSCCLPFYTRFSCTSCCVAASDKMLRFNRSHRDPSSLT